MDNRQTDLSHIYPAQDLQQATAKKFTANVFAWMFCALLISAAVSFFTTLNMDVVASAVISDAGKLNLLGWGIMLAPLGFVLAMSLGFHKLSAPVMTALFLIYAAINGVSFAFILAAYTTGSVIGCFVAAAGMFGLMAVMGYTTDKDLTGFGQLMFMGLIGIILASVLNWFMGSATMDWIISIVGVLVFTGLTAYDVQKIKRIGEGLQYEGTETASIQKLSVLGALSLYLDFVNLFLYILRLFGGRKN